MNFYEKEYFANYTLTGRKKFLFVNVFESCTCKKVFRRKRQRIRILYQSNTFHIFKSGLGYIVGSGVAILAGNWRWGIRITPILACIALTVGIIALTDPPRGKIIRNRKIDLSYM